LAQFLAGFAAEDDLGGEISHAKAGLEAVIFELGIWIEPTLSREITNMND
jgi:hypothetical protein